MEVMDYESDNYFIGHDESKLSTLMRENESRHAPKRIHERGVANEMTAIRFARKRVAGVCR